MTLVERFKKAWHSFWSQEQPEADKKPSLYGPILESDLRDLSDEDLLKKALNRVFLRNSKDDWAIDDGDSEESKFAMDGVGNACSFETPVLFFQNTIPTILISWYAQQSFIGYQTAEIIAQHWLVDLACIMPAQDAMRNGYVATVNDGTDVPASILDDLKRLDVQYRINAQLQEAVQKNRVFGIRVIMFRIEYPGMDKDFYLKPFNIESIKPGSYKGIVQIDPYWMTPELDAAAAADPASMFFYEPTWWRVNGQRIHRTHLVILRNSEVGDILKPTYFYGGVSIPQKMYERVYAAERTANEAPMLALTKRTGVISTDGIATAVNQAQVTQRLQLQQILRDNYATKIIDKEREQYEQFDTSLNDLDAVIMTQYQICAAIAGIPMTKLFGVQLKGFATGEYEENSYHEMLKSIQTANMTPILDRHLLLLIHSEIMPKHNIPAFGVSITWNPLDSTTAKGKAEYNKLKSETAINYVTAGITSPEDERKRLANDPESGYSGLLSDNIELPDPSSFEDNPEVNSPSNENDPENQKLVEQEALGANRQPFSI